MAAAPSEAAMAPPGIVLFLLLEASMLCGGLAE
jgi:hypothetical protein